MGTPASNGKLCTKLSDMSIGDYIKCEYSFDKANILGTFGNLGVESELPELPVVPSIIETKGYFYFIKVDNGLLVADRMVHNSISWTELNSSSYIYGGASGILDGEKSSRIRILSQKEWTKYLTEGTCNGNVLAHDKKVWNTISQGDTPWGTGYTLCEHLQDNMNGLSRTACYLNGGYYDAEKTTHWSWHGSCKVMYDKNSPTQNGFGIEGSMAFRPTLEFVENTKSTNIWY